MGRDVISNMIFPELIQKKKYIIDISKGTINKSQLICDAYDILITDFLENGVWYNNHRVLLDRKILDCTVCNNSCINSFCTCENCPWKDKLDIFQHVTTNEDPQLESRLTIQAKRKLHEKRKRIPKAKVRTPGEFSLSRTIRVPWIKYMIENSENDEIQKHINIVSKQKSKILLYNKKQDYMVVLSETKYINGSIEYFLNSAYHKPYPSLLRVFK